MLLKTNHHALAKQKPKKTTQPWVMNQVSQSSAKNITEDEFILESEMHVHL